MTALAAHRRGGRLRCTASTLGARWPLIALAADRLPAALAAAILPLATSAAAQQSPAAPRPGDADLARPITVTFVDTPVRDVLFTFAEFANRSIIPGAEVTGIVSAEIRGQPWEVALRALLDAHGLVSRERDDGMILVETATRLAEREAQLPLETRAVSVTYASPAELQELVLPLLTERGRASAGAVTSTLVVTDIPRVLGEVEKLVQRLDAPVRQVDIAAKIIFVNRTQLDGFGISYDLKDTRGNQLNALAPGVADLNGDGAITPVDEWVPRGTDVVALGGNSIAALGNAADRIPLPTLSLLGSLVVGRSTLVTFIDALESAQLTEVEARPSVRVLHNRTARIVVGEETPVRVLDAGAQAQGGGANGNATLPVATVDYKETGVILEVAPRVTEGGEVLLSLSAERSSADLAPSDVGFVFRRQQAESEVLVANGETVVIGGLTVTEAAEVRAGIPLLMDLPLLGRLFQSRREETAKRDLLILVTPTVVPLPAP